MKMDPANKILRILIVDDHPLFVRGIKAILGKESDLTVCGESVDAESAISLIRTERPDVVLLDLQLKDSDGFEVLEEISGHFPNLKTLVFSGRDESLYAPRVLRAGACGYLPKVEVSEKLLVALRKVARGGIYLSEELETHFLKTLAGGGPAIRSPVGTLSNRELEVFTLYGSGQGTREIAGQLNLSIKTINTHRANIKKKLNVKTAGELAKQAVQWVRATGWQSSS